LNRFCYNGGGVNTVSTKKQSPEPFQYHPFEDLKKIMERKGVKVSAKATPSPEKTVSDEDFFRSAMREVLEIKEFRKIPLPPKKVLPVRKKGHSATEPLQVLEDIVLGKKPMDLCVTQEYVEWINHDLKGDIIRKLREGRFSVQDCLDLHGFTLEGAETEVEEFLGESLKKRRRCVKIIHGRGLRSPKGPVLKEALIKWLSSRHRKNVAAFVTARQCDGGLGALYVLLR
jgi:DNA-nicking Smr family endonuclease